MTEIHSSTIISTLKKKLTKMARKKYAICYNSYDIAWLALFYILGAKKKILTTPIYRPNAAAIATLAQQKLLFCDVKLDGNIDHRQLKRVLSDEIDILLTHDFAGKPVEYEKIAQLKQIHNFFHISAIDNGFGAKYQGINTAFFADISLISSTLSTTTVAAILTDDEDLANLLEHFAQGGMKQKAYWNYDVTIAAIHSSIDKKNAQEWIQQLDNLDQKIEQRRALKHLFDTNFQNAKLFLTQKSEPHIQSACTFYPIILNPELQCPKEDIYKELRSKNIQVNVHFKPIHQLTFCKDCSESSLPVATDFYRSELSLPLQNLSINQAKKEALLFLDILDRYSYRGCSF